MGKAELKPLAEHPQYVESARKLATLEQQLRASRAVLARPVRAEDKQAAIEKQTAPAIAVRRVATLSR
jgi:hypothetical protein